MISDRTTFGELDFLTVWLKYSGRGIRECGTGFTFYKNFALNIPKFRTINERISAVQVKTKFFNHGLINLYAPEEEKDNSVKDEFDSHFKSVFDSLSANEMKIAFGDFNASKRRGLIHRGTTIGHYFRDTTNTNGSRSIGFHCSRNMTISLACFPHRRIHKT